LFLRGFESDTHLRFMPKSIRKNYLASSRWIDTNLPNLHQVFQALGYRL
jgi:hypothetical protein